MGRACVRLERLAKISGDDGMPSQMTNGLPEHCVATVSE